MTTPTSPSPHDAGLPSEAEAWLREHPEADRAGLEAAWRLAGRAADDPAGFQPDPERIRRMEERIAAATRSADRPALRPVRRLRPALTWAAAAVVALFAVGWLLTRPVRVAAPPGERVAAVLPDGSSVELNSGSRLTYGRRFGAEARRVRLEGEAYFDVVRDPAPFVVETFNSRVTVLGTRFNVRAWTESDLAATTVVLEEGQVRLAAGDDAQAVVLDPGEMSVVPAGSVAPEPPTSAALETALAWRRGGFRFTDAPLGDILDELERRTGAEIDVADSDLRALRASILLDRVESADAVLTVLAEIRGLRVSRTGDGFLVSP